jgi:hypothetical protein
MASDGIRHANPNCDGECTHFWCDAETRAFWAIIAIFPKTPCGVPYIYLPKGDDGPIASEQEQDAARKDGER